MSESLIMLTPILSHTHTHTQPGSLAFDPKTATLWGECEIEVCKCACCVCGCVVDDFTFTFIIHSVCMCVRL
jgi:hypothetical protein